MLSVALLAWMLATRALGRQTDCSAAGQAFCPGGKLFLESRVSPSAADLFLGTFEHRLTLT